MKPKARYLSFTEYLAPARGVTGTAYRVRDLSTGEVVGELLGFGYGGGWAERFLSAFSDAGSGPIFRIDCNVRDFGRIPLLQALFNLGE